jgi:hypothetical protein
MFQAAATDSFFDSRLQRVVEEVDLSNFTPICGLRDEPLLSLSQAVSGLAEITRCPNLAYLVELSQDKAECVACELEPPLPANQHGGETLTLDESAAIHLYTIDSNFYKTFTAALVRAYVSFANEFNLSGYCHSV